MKGAYPALVLASAVCLALACAAAPAYGLTFPPEPVASFADETTIGGKTYDTLNGTQNIVTVKIGDGMYALASSLLDNGVQIIDITDPANPAPVASFANGTTVGGKTFDALYTAVGITTVEIDGSVYALVASYFGSGVQIANITDPANPAPVTSFAFGDFHPNGNLYDALFFPSEITTVKMGDGVYALVAAQLSNGVQIVDITNITSPAPVASFANGTTVGGKTFDGLVGASGITTVEIGANVYALVAATGGDSVQIVDITNITSPAPVASFRDGDTVRGKTFDKLDNAIYITTVEIGTDVYALVTAQNDDGVQIVDITNITSPAPVASFGDGDTARGKTYDMLDGARGITTVRSFGQGIYALVTAELGDGVQIVDITDPASPAPVASFGDNDTVGGKAFDGLEGASGITTVEIGANVYALVASSSDDSVQIINLGKKEDEGRATVQGEIVHKRGDYKGVCKVTLRDVNPYIQWDVDAVMNNANGVEIKSGMWSTLPGDTARNAPLGDGASLLAKSSSSGSGAITVQLSVPGIDHTQTHSCDITLGNTVGSRSFEAAVPKVAREASEGSPRFVARMTETENGRADVMCLARMGYPDTDTATWLVDIRLTEGAAGEGDDPVQTLLGVEPTKKWRWMSENVVRDGDTIGKNSIKAANNHVAARMLHYDVDPADAYSCSYEMGAASDQRDESGAVILDPVTDATVAVPNIVN